MDSPSSEGQPCMPGSASHFGNPGSNSSNVLQSSSHLPSAHTLPGLASSHSPQAILSSSDFYKVLSDTENAS